MLLIFKICLFSYLLLSYADIGDNIRSSAMMLSVKSTLKAMLYYEYVALKNNWLYFLFIVLLLIFDQYTSLLLISIICILCFVLPSLYVYFSSVILMPLIVSVLLFAQMSVITSLLSIGTVIIIFTMLRKKAYQVLSISINRRVVYVFELLLVVTFITLHDNLAIELFPIEQIIGFIVLSYIAVLENEYKENKQLVSRFQSRFRINIVKNTIPNLLFLSMNQIERFVFRSIEILIVLLVCVIKGSMDASVIMLALVMLCYTIYYVDYITYHLLLRTSIVYENRVVSLIINFIFSTVVFSEFIMNALFKFSDFQKIYSGDSTFMVTRSLLLVSSLFVGGALINRQIQLYKMNN